MMLNKRLFTLGNLLSMCKCYFGSIRSVKDTLPSGSRELGELDIQISLSSVHLWASHGAMEGKSG